MHPLEVARVTPPTMHALSPRQCPPRQCPPRPLCRLILLAAPGVLLSFAVGAAARSRGIDAPDCTGCHGATQNSSISLDYGELQLGTQAELVFTVQDPDAAVAGIAILAKADLEAGPGLGSISTGLLHTSPKEFQNGEVRFTALFNVPSTPGALRLTAASVSANGNRNFGGDEGVSMEVDIVYGCEPQVFYFDGDRDGYGDDDWTQIFCAGTPPDEFAAVGGDCENYREAVYPGAVELCNRRDDDCDGEIDENAEPIPLFPDADGDGYYSSDEYLSGDMVMGCLPYEGYAAEPGDCRPRDSNIHPGAEEVCDGVFDENCDGRVDERLRPICGEGWCARESRSCHIEDCTPGQPIQESCNLFDDDCDGEVDEGDLCPEGQVCAAGECREAGEVGEGPTLAQDETTSGDPKESSPGGATEDPSDDPSDDPGSPEGAPEQPSAGCQLYRSTPSHPRPAKTSWFVGFLFLASLLRRRVRRK